MSLIFATQLTALATAVLAVFAIVTAFYARRAFLKQSQEVRAIEQQVQDAQELARQQGNLLNVQSGQLELQRQQFAEQRKLNERQTEVLTLQAAELRESLEERKREAVERRNAQASQVHLALKVVAKSRDGGPEIEATVVNASERQQPIYDVKLYWCCRFSPGESGVVGRCARRHVAGFATYLHRCCSCCW
jgi:hypothetical protein